MLILADDVGTEEGPLGMVFHGLMTMPMYYSYRYGAESTYLLALHAHSSQPTATRGCSASLIIHPIYHVEFHRGPTAVLVPSLI